MKLARAAGLCLLLCAAAGGVEAQKSPAAGAGAAPPAVEDLGQGRYRVGTILIDKKRASFSVPGRVLAQEMPNAPMEFLAGTKGGLKNYEAALELDTSAIAFNVACLLIGLDAGRGALPRMHFDSAVLEGESLNVFIQWEKDGKRMSIRGEEAMSHQDPSGTPHDWVYTGSRMDYDGLYVAEKVGTLIGFVHDPDSIIQHRKGLGLGRYGSVVMNTKVLPPPGTSITILVERLVPGAPAGGNQDTR